MYIVFAGAMLLEVHRNAGVRGEDDGDRPWRGCWVVKG